MSLLKRSDALNIRTLLFCCLRNAFSSFLEQKLWVRICLLKYGVWPEPTSRKPTNRRRNMKKLCSVSMISLLEVVVIKRAMDFQLSSNRSIDYRLLRGLRKVIYPNNANTRKDDCRSHREHLARQKPMSYLIWKTSYFRNKPDYEEYLRRICFDCTFYSRMFV